MRRETLRLLARSRWVWALLPLTLLLIVVVLLVVSLAAPYRPFVLAGYRVTPTVVCPGGEVTAAVTRRFTQRFDYLRLSEQWVTVEAPGLDPGLPVGAGESGTLPGRALNPTPRLGTVPSPLLDSAPTRPGVYRVRIVAEFEGSRWLLPAIGDATFKSNLVRVLPCTRREGPP